jgi:tetratricopeptide (TPR) repeat protein
MTGGDDHFPVATDGEIAATNLESARHRAWSRFAQDPRLPGLAEAILDQEHLAAQFLGDLHALGRVEALSALLAGVDDSFRAELVSAEAASMGHRFVDARDHLARAALLGAPADAIARQRLTIDQACGVDLDAVLAARGLNAEASERLEDLVPFGAALADFERFDEADSVYRQAFQARGSVSPFPLAMVCFQLGMLWGELVPEPDPDLAAACYRRAIAYVPRYVRARVHLAEVYMSENRTKEAEDLLWPALSSDDPECRWRLADVLAAQERFEEAEHQLDAARLAFDGLLANHLLAFADHAAEFYAGSGNDHARAMELAQANVANRPTRRAIKQECAIAQQSRLITSCLRVGPCPHY